MLPPYAFFWMMFPLFLIARNTTTGADGKVALTILAWLQLLLAVILLVTHL